MLEKLVGVSQRLTQLRSMLAARDGKPGYTESVVNIKAEILRLEQITQKPAALASDDKSGEVS